MMNQMGGQSQFSDEDLRKLAILLQQMPANEGLATVTPGEEDYMEDAFKSGKPLQGTQGLGPDGGLVQSFQPPGGGETNLGSGAAGGSSGGSSDPSPGGSSGGYSGPASGAMGAAGHGGSTTSDPSPTGSGASGDQGRSGGYGGDG